MRIVAWVPMIFCCKMHKYTIATLTPPPTPNAKNELPREVVKTASRGKSNDLARLLLSEYAKSCIFYTFVCIYR